MFYCYYRYNYTIFSWKLLRRNHTFTIWKDLCLCGNFHHISLITNTHETLLKCKEPVKRFRASKIKRAKARIIYYNNSIATFNIILSNDIEQNPWPGLPRPKCPRCDKTVRCNQKRLICQLCLDVVLPNCANLKHCVRNSIDAERWTCENYQVTRNKFKKTIKLQKRHFCERLCRQKTQKKYGAQ